MVSVELTLYTVTYEGYRIDEAYDDWECQAIWAKDRETAERIWLENVPVPHDEVVPKSWEHPDIECDVAQEGIETRPEVLRRAEWRYDGEVSCDGCGLYPFDMPQFEVCRECYHCPECGCCSYCETGRTDAKANGESA